MINSIIAKNTTVTNGINSYIEKKFSKFDKYAPVDTVVRTKIEVVRNGVDRHKIEVTIPFGKQILRAEESDEDMYAAIDKVEEKMSELLKRRKEKIVDTRHKKDASIAVEVENEADNSVENDAPEYEIARVKIHELVPMTVYGAIEAMEMIGHPFYVYIDADKDKVCAVYRREDNTYGQIVYND